MPNDYYTWSEFVGEVKKLLPIESQRVGVNATDYLNSLIRQAVIDLQRVVPGFCIGHETIYYKADMVQEGSASRFVLPPQCKFRDMTMFTDLDDGSCQRNPVKHFSWDDRFALIEGSVAVNSGVGFCSVDMAGKTAYVYPTPIDEEWNVSFFWDGTKLDFKDEEQVPLTEAAALAVSYFVKGHTSLEAEDNASSMSAYLALYAQQKTKLYLDWKDSRGVTD